MKTPVRHKMTRITQTVDGVTTSWSGFAVVLHVKPLNAKQRKHLAFLCGQWNLKLEACEFALNGPDDDDYRRRNEDCGATAYLAMCTSADLEECCAALDWVTSPLTMPTYVRSWSVPTTVRVLSGQGNGAEKQRASKAKNKPEVTHPIGAVCPISGLPTDLTERPVSAVSQRNPQKESSNPEDYMRDDYGLPRIPPEND